MTIEDECGLVNVILRPQTYVKYRHIARMEPIIAVEGMLQKSDGIINVVAERLLPLKDEQERQRSTHQPAAPKARNFA
jgi:error-prone DNA polymerase